MIFFAFHLDVFRNRGPKITMSFDASPWGAGGFLQINGSLVSWFATKFCKVDEEAINIVFGTSSSQQVAEALAILFGLRMWIARWSGHAPRLKVRSDSVTALSLVARMRSNSPQMSVVARELALTRASSCIRPSLVEHTPGVANKLADALSRRFQPGTDFLVPEALVDVPECNVLFRTPEYYRTIGGLEQIPLCNWYLGGFYRVLWSSSCLASSFSMPLLGSPGRLVMVNSSSCWA